MLIFFCRNLHFKLSGTYESDTFAFIDPGSTFKLNDEFERYIVKRLKEGNADRIFFLPHNQK